MLDSELGTGTDEIEERAGRIAERWWRRDCFAIEMLQEVQDTYHYLPSAAMAAIGEKTGVPLARLYGIASFYKAFTLEPRGRHTVSVCLGTACHVQGGPRILDAVQRELGAGPGETDATGEFTVEEVRCVGCCGLAAVVTVDEDVYGKVAPHRVGRLLSKYRTGARKGAGG